MKFHFKNSLFVISLCLAGKLQLLTAAPIEWVGGTSDDLSTNTNWSPATVPVSGDTATFSSSSSNHLPLLTGGATLTTDTFEFPVSTPLYHFTIEGAGTVLNLGTSSASTGVNNLSTTSKIFDINDGAHFNFLGSSSADVSDAEDITYKLANASAGAPSQLNFFGSSTAVLAPIKPSGNSVVTFSDNSNPDHTAITATTGSTVVFDTTNTTTTARVNLSASTAIISKSITVDYISSFDADSAVELQNGSTLTIGDSSFGVRPLHAAITGSGELIKQHTGSISIPNNDNSYTGGTKILAGALLATTTSLPLAADLSPIEIVSTPSSSPQTTLLFSSAGTSPIFSGDIYLNGVNSVVGIGTGITAVLTGNITGTGILAVVDGADLTLTGTNTYTGNTGVNGTLHATAANLPVGGNILTNQGFHVPPPVVDFTTTSSDETYSGIIKGIGSVQLSGPGRLTLTGDNTYTGGTHVLDGTLVGNTLSIPVATAEPSITIVDGATFEFNQSFDDTYYGSVSGEGTLQKTGAGILTLDASNPDFVGTAEVTDGGLKFNTFLGGNVNVRNAILYGNGTIAGKLALKGGAVVSPGNSIGILAVGSYSQTSTDTYAVEVTVAGESDRIDVANDAALAGTVQVTSLDGPINPATRYLIMDVGGEVTGAFENVVVTNDNRVVGNTSYELDAGHTNVFLIFESVFSAIAETFNQRQVGQQLAGITDPSPALNAILDEVALLASSPATLNLALLAYDQMSGVQYTDAILTAEANNHQFLKRMYDPLRSIISTVPCYCEDLCCECGPLLDTWFEVGGGRKIFESTKNVHGFKINSFDIVGGVQGTFKNEWTFGLAGSYINDRLSYNRLGGYGKSYTGFGGLYGLYRPNNWYVLADAAFGYSHNKIKRRISAGTLDETITGKPGIYQSAGYLEGGFDIDYCSVLFQPFVGVELSYLKRDHITERGASPLNLNVNERKYKNAYSRLGMHLTTDNIWANTFLSLDLSWQYRMTSFNNTIRERFQSFGNEFIIEGLNLGRNSMNWALTSSTSLDCGWTLYAEASGEVYSKSYVYDFLGGIKCSW